METLVFTYTLMFVTVITFNKFLIFVSLFRDGITGMYTKFQIISLSCSRLISHMQLNENVCTSLYFIFFILWVLTFFFKKKIPTFYFDNTLSPLLASACFSPPLFPPNAMLFLSLKKHQTKNNNPQTKQN